MDKFNVTYLTTVQIVAENAFQAEIALPIPNTQELSKAGKVLRVSWGVEIVEDFSMTAQPEESKT